MARINYQSLIFIIGIFSLLELNAQAFQNGTGFFGDRASGMAGAFTAISDDASGAYYNPGGLGFAIKKSFTTSGSAYQDNKDLYNNVDGLGKDYKRNSSTYLPNFVGFVTGSDSLKFGFSFASPYQALADVADTVRYPLQLANGNYAYKNYVSINKEELSRIQFGPSLGWRISDNLSIGATLYYTRESRTFIAIDEYESLDGNLERENYYDRKLSIGFQPIIGLVYSLTEKIYLGTSIRRIFTTAGKRNSYYSVPPYLLYKSGDGAGGTNSDGVPFIQSKSNVSMPSPIEIRAGIAYYYSERLLLASDLIHHSSYHKKGDNYIVEFYENPTVTFGDREYLEIRRRETNNISLGLEYFLNSSFSIRMGYFTNVSSNKKIKWVNSAVEAAVYEYLGNKIQLNEEGNLFYEGIRGGHYQYSFNEMYYQDDRSVYGQTLGLSYNITSNTVVGLTFIHGKGKGGAVYYFNSPSTPITTVQNQINFSITAMNE